MKRKVLLLAYFLALLTMAKAQPALGIVIDSNSVSNDTVPFNQIITLNLTVRNTGDTSFNGTFAIRYAVDSVFQGTLDSLATNGPLPAGQSMPVVINHQITPDIYGIGDNIVVIWPVAIVPAAPTSDSGTIHIYVDTLLGIGAPVLKENIRVFYNPSNAVLTIDYGDVEKEISSVGVYSLIGQQILTYNYPVKKFSLAENSSQIFLLRIQTKKGETISFKILRI